MAGGGSFLGGQDPYIEKVSLLTSEQRKLDKQRQAALQGKRGAGGAFGTAADYYYDILNDNPEAFAAYEAPEQRRFREETIPELSEQFAGMGAGNLSSSGFRNAAVSAGTDLSERLAEIRANLKRESASALANMGQQGLSPVRENVYHPGKPSFGEQVLTSGAKAGLAYVTRGASMAGDQGGGGTQNTGSSVNASSPYGTLRRPGYS